MYKKQLIIAGFGLAIAIAAYLYFFSNSSVRLAKETTFITSPLAEDGLPNYVLAILERQRKGVTADNNAAPLFWQAIGPAEMDPKEFAVLCEALDIDLGDPPTTPFLVDVAGDDMADQLAQWIAEQEGALAKRSSKATSLLESIQTRPWTDKQLPPLANWVAENNAALNLLVEASKKPYFFSPPPNALLDTATPVLEMNLAHVRQARAAVRSLAARAMHNLAAGQHKAAWEDVHACWRFGQLIGDDRRYMELLVGLAIRRVAQHATLAILDSEALPKGLAAQIQSDLAALKPDLDLKSSIDFYERIMFLDTTLRSLSGRLGGIEGREFAAIQRQAAIDLNVPLERGNRFYDQLVTALAIDEGNDRTIAIQTPYDDLEARSQKTIPQRILSAISRTSRAEVMGDVFLAIMAPALTAGADAWQRDHAELLLTRVASALALYRTEHGEYPTTLKELVAKGILPAIPTDPYVNAPFRYERRGDGYLLYSLSQNCVDDGGDDFVSPILDGEWIPESKHSKPGPGEGDLVIRVPLPPFQLPVESTVNDAEP